MKPLIFLGSNSVLERYIETAERQAQKIHGLIDTDYFGNTPFIIDVPVVDSFAGLELNLDHYRNNFVFFIATNWNPMNLRDKEKRNEIISLVKRLGLTCINLIDKTSYVSRFATLGQGIFVGASTVIEPRSTVEDFCNVGDQVIVGHDSVIGENTVLARHSGVHAKLGKNCYLSVHSYVWDHGGGVTVGNNVFVSPSVWVKRDIADNEYISLDKNSIRTYRNHIRE